MTQALYLIRKRGAFYRPNAEGYTMNRAEAGRYTLAEAISHSHPNGSDGPRDGIDYMLANDPDKTDANPATDPTRAVATEPQEVTVAPIDVNAAASLDDALGFLTDRERPIVEQAFARHRLASVSSASAAKPQAVPVLCDFYLGDCRRCERRANATNQQEPCARPNGRFAPSPEPVPATNQAGEVALREACERLLLAMTTRALRGRDHVPSMRDEQTAASALRAALATQPATSQEGARHPGWTAAGHKWLDAGCAPIAAKPTTPTYTQAQREQAARVLRVGEPVALEPGKWEALVDAVAEALGMRKAGA